jgi:hypothetical protein
VGAAEKDICPLKMCVICHIFFIVSPSPGSAESTYNSKCADIEYFIENLKVSPVEFYAGIYDEEAIDFMFSFLSVIPPHKDIDTVLFLYNPEKRDAVGIIPLVGGCALEETYLGIKMQVDQILAAVLHQGHVVVDRPDELRNLSEK